jgi:RND family efflux transporter MFP subunit
LLATYNHRTNELYFEIGVKMDRYQTKIATRLTVICLLSSLSLLLLACTTAQSDSAETSSAIQIDGDSDGEEQKTVEVTVRVKTVEAQEIAPQTEASGTVASERDITIVSQTAGRVTLDNMTLGKQVAKGDPLLVVDTESYRIALDAANAQLSQAKTALSQTEKDFRRAEQLYQSGDISEQMFDSTRFAFERSQGAVDAAQASVANASRNLREATIRAPFGGEIAAKLVKLGDSIAVGTPIAQLVDRSGLKVNLGVSEQVIGNLKVGLLAHVLIPTLNNEPFEATISAIGPKALQPTMTYPVEVVFNNPPDSVRIGMVARVTLQVGDTRNGLLVPVEVMHEKFDHHYVWLIKDNIAKETEVKTGERIGQSVVVTEGLKPGDMLVVSGEAKLKNDDRVKIVE